MRGVCDPERDDHLSVVRPSNPPNSSSSEDVPIGYEDVFVSIRGLVVKELSAKWGREVNLIDLAGVCWHIGQRE